MYKMTTRSESSAQSCTSSSDDEACILMSPDGTSMSWKWPVAPYGSFPCFPNTEGTDTPYVHQKHRQHSRFRPRHPLSHHTLSQDRLRRKHGMRWDVITSGHAVGLPPNRRIRGVSRTIPAGAILHCTFLRKIIAWNGEQMQRFLLYKNPYSRRVPAIIINFGRISFLYKNPTCSILGKNYFRSKTSLFKLFLNPNHSPFSWNT